MNDEVQLIVSKIEKMWRMATNAAATPHERAAFEARALAMMEENRITMAMLEIDPDDVLGDHVFGPVEGRYAKVTCKIISAVAQAYDCRVWWYNYRSQRDVRVFGFKTDAQRVITLSKMLIADAQAQAAKESGRTPAETFSLRRNFILGYSEVLWSRLREAARLAGKAVEERDAQAAHGASLVLVSRRQQVAEKYATKGLRHESPASVGNYAAWTRGAEAGRNASLSTQAKVAPRKALTPCT